MTSISAVLPAYNEEALIGDTATAVAEVLAEITDDYEVIVVDDGSRDGTREVVGEVTAANPRVRCISHEMNRGYGDALKTGFSAAAKDSIFLTDGDRQFDVRELAQFVPHLGGADLVIGYRNPRRDSLVRLVYAWGWRWVVTLLFGYVARDIDCAFKLFSRDVWQRVQVHSGGATFSAEFLAKARRCGYRVLELPVTHYPRTAGSPTGAKPHVVARAFRDIIWLRFHLEPCPDPETSRSSSLESGVGERNEGH
jgi:glycosyltransferase involved in cell wall biosynthesis